MIEKFGKIIDGLKEQRGMYLIKDDYFTLVHFIIGYELALKEKSLELEVSNFQTWFSGKIEKRNNVHWAIYIYNKMAFKDESKAIEIVFNYFEEYFESFKGTYKNDAF